MNSVAPGTRLGPYEIASLLGEGGMGQVYLARDTKLNRDVALKLLPASVAHDPDRLARFRREAQVLAALNHPNIAHIYGLEDSTDQPALVMELVPGRTLAEVIADGATPWPDAVPIARQIAEALEAAHERGIVHRDLKPANIKLRHDGVVKVLDFGLAKAMDPDGAEGASSGAALPPSVFASPTITSPAHLGHRKSYAATEAGIILGTAAYMAPEQATGRAVDKRVDIWAFGVVLTEMMIGGPLFAGASMAETIASVMKDDPKLDRLPANTPEPLRGLLARCLERDPKQRLRDIGEARIVLSQPLTLPPPAAVARAGGRNRVAAAVGAVLLAVAAGGAAWSFKPALPVPVRRFELPGEIADAKEFAISPDGARLAYLLNGHLFVRRLDELDGRDLGLLPPAAQQLVWSPDGDRLAFAAEASVQTIPSTGGSIFVVARIPGSGRTTGMAWLPGGTIAFSVWRDSLYEVHATGGTPVVRLRIDEANEVDFHHVSAVPDGRLVIATHRRKEDSDVIELVEGQKRTILTSDPTVGWFEYTAPGMLLFDRRTTNVGVWAVPFSGGPIDVNSAAEIQPGATAYSVARDGTLVALIARVPRLVLIGVDRNGAESAVPGAPIAGADTDVELSPDGTRAAFVLSDRLQAGPGIGSRKGAAIFVRDLATGVDTRVTPPQADPSMWGEIGPPTWFPAGDRLLNRQGSVESSSLVERRADSAGDVRVITTGFSGRVLDDGRTLVYLRDERGRIRLRMATIAPDGVRDDKPLFEGDAAPHVRDFDVSPGGRLIAYLVEQPGGRGDIYVSALDDLRAQRIVQEGGSRPRFSAQGDLFYLAGTVEAGRQFGRLMHVAIASGSSSLSIGPATEVFREESGGRVLQSYDVAPDGKRLFLWKRAAAEPAERQRLVLVQNSLAGIRR
jgi:eukaryotic-like serine/threonine-protein kinase